MYNFIMIFQVFEYEVLSAEDNMKKDTELLETLDDSILLRIYSWKDNCITYGYNQNEELVNKICENKKFFNYKEITKRPTGGGVVFHYPCQLSWSLFFPLVFFKYKSLLSFYYKISEIYLSVLQKNNIDSSFVHNKKKSFSEKRINDICLDFPAKYEIVNSKGQKLIGSAQKKTQNAFLQQNVLFLKEEPTFFRENLYDTLKKNLLSLTL
jgi:lipoate-protein ligase A